MLTEWPTLLDQWTAEYECRCFKGALPEDLAKAESRLGKLPVELAELLSCSNGLVCEWFKLLPVEDPADIKRTWDGLARANDPENPRHLWGDASLLDQFLVFALLDAERVAAISRHDGSIWYEEDDELNQLDCSLAEFIELTLREVAEL